MEETGTQIKVIGIGSFGESVINKTTELLIKHNINYEIINENNKNQIDTSKDLDMLIIIADLVVEQDRKIALNILRTMKNIHTVIIGKSVNEEKNLEDFESPIISIERQKSIDEIVEYSYLSLKAIIELIYESIACMDLSDLWCTLSSSSLWSISFGQGIGKNKISESTEKATNGLSNKYNLEEVKNCVIYIVAGNDLSLHEVNVSTEMIQNSLKSDANIIFSYSKDSKLKDDEMRVMMLCGK